MVTAEDHVVAALPRGDPLSGFLETLSLGLFGHLNPRRARAPVRLRRSPFGSRHRCGFRPGPCGGLPTADTTPARVVYDSTRHAPRSADAPSPILFSRPNALEVAALFHSHTWANFTAVGQPPIQPDRTCFLPASTRRCPRLGSLSCDYVAPWNPTDHYFCRNVFSASHATTPR